MGVTSRRPATQADRAERSDWPDQLVALYEQTYRDHVRLVYAMVGSRHEAEELVQESVIEIGRHWGEIDQPGAYLRRTVVNRAIGLLRSRGSDLRTGGDRRPGLARWKHRKRR
jgi:DNA-directed RNA polymerase specialized sigma24 family protein